MAGLTLIEAETRLQKYLDAEEKILLGQAVDMEGTRLTRADLDAVQRGIALWNTRVIALSASASGSGGSGIKVVEVVPR